MSASSERIGVLFVCMGNICRSPLAEGVFVQKVNQRGVAARFRVDSAGTGAWHAGEEADERIQKIAKKAGFKLTGRARQITERDFEKFDYILCADKSNMKDVLAMGAPADRVALLLDHLPGGGIKEVPDPYYGGEEGFATVFELVNSACEGFLDSLVGPAPDDES